MLTKPFFACIVLLALMSFTAGQTEIKSPLQLDLSKTYGYVTGQKFGIEVICQQFPELTAQARKAQLEFDLNFQASYENIATELQNQIGDQWKEFISNINASLQKMAAETYDKSRVSKQDVVIFINEVTNRAKGQIPSPYLETLLTYHPAFQRSPAEEYARGFTQTYRTKTHPKSKGVDFQIQYPRSWKAQEGRRPNVIQLFTSENGRGFDEITLMVTDIPVPPRYKVTQAEINDLFTPKSLREMLPEGSIFISAKPITLDGRKGGMIIFDQILQRLDVTMRLRSLHFITFYNNKLIFIQCGTVEPSNSISSLDARFKKLEALFRFVGNSFVIQSQYQ